MPPMTQATFYLLDQNGPEADHFACRLAYKAWRGGLPAHIHTRNEHHCHAMDRLLWEWQEDRFLPHVIIHSRHPPETPVTLGYREPKLNECRLLINLDTKVPAFFKDFDRICEIVVEHPDQKESSRAKFKTFRQLGIRPETHDMKARR